MMTPTVLPVTPGALSAGTGVMATGIQIPASVAAGIQCFYLILYILVNYINILVI